MALSNTDSIISATELFPTIVTISRRKSLNTESKLSPESHWWGSLIHSPNKNNDKNGKVRQFYVLFSFKLFRCAFFKNILILGGIVFFFTSKDNF